MHFSLFRAATKGSLQQELTISDEVMDEPPEEFFLSFDIISDDEIARLRFPFRYGSSSSISSSATSISSQGSCSSLGSAGMHPSPSVIKGPTRTNYSSQKNQEDHGDSSSTGSTLPDITEEELTASIRIWYLIQKKGHSTHDPNEEDLYYQYQTMENSSMKRTNWFHNLLHIHERIRQHMADKHRFDISKIPEETRKQLKHLYVY